MSDKEIENGEREAATIPCCLEVTEHEIHGAAELPTLLARIFEDGKIAGIMWATNGTRSVNGLNPASPGQGATLKVSSPDGFDISQVYEARIWRVINDNGDATLAHEFRWVNGMDAVELTLRAYTEEPGAPTRWANYVAYEQHVSSGEGPQPNHNRTSQITAIEYIEEDSMYGNMVVVDQLFTGKWK